MKGTSHGNAADTAHIETRLNRATDRGLDKWRAKLNPQPSKSEAARHLPEERLFVGQSAVESPQPRCTCPDAERLGALYALERVHGFGPAKFRALHEAGIDPQVAIENPDMLPFSGKIGEKLRRGLAELSIGDLATSRSQAIEQLDRAEKHSASILVHGDPNYPKRVYMSTNPVPVLYVRGNPATWDDGGSVAVVGSRKTREPYAKCARSFAVMATRMEMVVVSGFALGTDSIGHAAALNARGRTICVMPCGLDNVFPSENRGLWEELLAYPGAAFVSEVGFGHRASSLLLRKRNKLIVAFAQGVMVAQSGTMNAYRFGREQRKPVATFRSDGSKKTSGNPVIAKDIRTGPLAFEWAGNESNCRAWLLQLSSLI